MLLRCYDNAVCLLALRKWPLAMNEQVVLNVAKKCFITVYAPLKEIG